MITQVDIDATMNSIHGAFFLYYYTFVALLTDAEIGKFASNLPLLTCDLWAYFDRLLLITGLKLILWFEPERAMVPRLSVSSSRVIPMP